MGHLAVFYGDVRCFCVCVFSGPDLWVHSEIRGSPGRDWGSPGEGFREGKPLPERGLREPFHNSARLMAQGPPDIYIYIYIHVCAALTRACTLTSIVAIWVQGLGLGPCAWNEWVHTSINISAVGGRGTN